jgi:hypothetical protein
MLVPDREGPTMKIGGLGSVRLGESMPKILAAAVLEPPA